MDLEITTDRARIDATPFGYLGAVPLVTGLVGFCPLYGVFGLNTCPKRR